MFPRYRPAFRWQLTTTVMDTEARILQFVAHHGWQADKCQSTARMTVWRPLRGGRGNGRDELLKINISANALGSEIHVRGTLYKWILVGFFAWLPAVMFVPIGIREGFLFGAFALAGVFSLFPLIVYLVERSDAAGRVRRLAEQLAAVRFAPPPPAMGPYR
jgi:hypothetical protein